jgi:hypothetical protein
MSETTVKTTKELAERINDFIQEATGAYIRNDARSNKYPLEFIRISPFSAGAGTKTLLVALHIRDTDTGETGDVISQKRVNVTDEALSNFTDAYAITQVHRVAPIEEPYIDYYIINFQGTYLSISVY